MSTKISGVDTPQIASIGAGRAVSRAADSQTGASQSSVETASEDVQITGAARNLAKLEQTVRDLPIVDETRVDHIRASIEQGTYSVRPQHIADQLLSLERSLKSLPDAGEPDSPDPEQTGK